MPADHHLTELRELDPEEERKRYKIVRIDTFQDVPGKLILSADVRTGICVMLDNAGERKEYNFGPRSLVIIKKTR